MRGFQESKKSNESSKRNSRNNNEKNNLALFNKAQLMQKKGELNKAAEMYQKAGLFAEAGRIRQTYLENEKPMVQIGQIGDSVVKDSVIMGDKQSNLCPNCGDAIQPEWKFCPSCNIPL